MSRVDVNQHELRSAFNLFRKHAPDAMDSKCCCLDALYAVECGISIILLREKKEKTTKYLQGLTANHDINALLKLCNAPPPHRLPSRINLSQDRSVSCYSVSHADLHSALRYGAKMSEEEWKKCAKILIEISRWIVFNLEER